MKLCEVVKVEDQWFVYAVNPDNPDDRRLVNVCESEEYANGLADDLNRFAEIAAERNKTASAKRDVPPRPKHLFDLETGESVPKRPTRKFRLTE